MKLIAKDSKHSAILIKTFGTSDLINNTVRDIAAILLAILASLAVVLRKKATNFSPAVQYRSCSPARRNSVGVVTSLNENLIFPKGE